MPPLSVPFAESPIQEPEIIRVSQALQRLRKNCQTVIETPEKQTEIRGDLQLVSFAMVAHAEEFLHLWGIVRHEYEPLVRALAIPVARGQAGLQPRPAE